MGQAVGEAMGQRDELKNRHPPKAVEYLIGRLIPRGQREHIIGDMHERYQSPLRYLADAVTAAPAAILCQIRRATPPLFLMLEALVVYVSFLGGAALLPGMFGPVPFAQISRTTAIVMAGLLIRDAYASFPSESRRKLIASVYLAVYFSCGTMFLWADITKDLTLFPGPLTACPGLVISSAAVSLLRIWIEKPRKDRLRSA